MDTAQRIARASWPVLFGSLFLGLLLESSLDLIAAGVGAVAILAILASSLYILISRYRRIQGGPSEGVTAPG
jgi:hypothetical protein